MVAPADSPVPRDASERVLRTLRRRRALWRFLASVCRVVSAAGGSVHLVGGFVRDLVEGRPGKDVDLMVTGIRFDTLGDTLASLPAKALGIRRIVVAGKRFSVYKVATTWSVDDVDVALARCGRPAAAESRGGGARNLGNDAREDASRRDFTINSLLFAFRFRRSRLGGEVIDFFGGLPDLRRNRIRGVGDPAERFREDPLRLLRAIRLKNERPGSTIERGTWRALRAAGPALAGTIPRERAIAEILRSLSANPVGTIDDLHRSGLLAAILPEGCGRSLARMKRRYALLGNSLGHPLPETVLLANLLVDPAAAEVRAPGPRGAAGTLLRLPKTEAIARRLHVPRVRRVVRMVEDLYRLSRARRMPNSNARIESIFGRWEEPRWLMAFYEAAREASSRTVEDFRPLLRRAARKAPLLSGRDILGMGVPGGPEVESILERVREATLSGEVASRNDAAALVASLSGDGLAQRPVHRRRRSKRSARRSPARTTASTAPSGGAERG